MLIGLMAAALACVGYGTASVLQAYGARSSEVEAAGHAQRTEVTATGAPTLRSTIHAALTPTFIAGMVLDIVGFLGSIVSARLIPLFLICLGDPCKRGDPLVVFVVWRRSGHVPYRGGPAVGVEVERPQRSEDERPRGRRGSAAYSVGQDETKEVVVQVICGPPVRQHGRESIARAGAQPYLGPRTRVRRHDDGWGARRAGW